MNSGWTRNRKDADRRFSPAHEPIADVDHAYPVDVVQDVLQLSQIVKLYETLGFEHFNTDF